MKRITIIAAILLTSTMLFAQSVEFTPLFGYDISGKVNGYYGTFDVKDDISFGGILSVEVDNMSYIELGYQRTNTEVAVSSYGDFLVGNRTDLAVEHYQVGFLREFAEGKVVPFAKLSLGTTRYAQMSDGNDRYWLFSTGVGFGAKVFLNEMVGLRLHTNLILPMEFAGGGIFCGIGGGGGGCSTAVTFNVPLVHWNLGVGLIIKLPN
ncbi:MAG: hypothetical protein L3J54_04830 [Draconibacterium sp.]|nr:hypothetical protein [Draconibacterium sp.]